MNEFDRAAVEERERQAAAWAVQSAAAGRTFREIGQHDQNVQAEKRWRMRQVEIGNIREAPGSEARVPSSGVLGNEAGPPVTAATVWDYFTGTRRSP